VALLASHAWDQSGVSASYIPSLEPASKQCSHLRDLFGPLPFRPISLQRAILHWKDATIPKIVKAIYDDRTFDRLPALADALDQAGCTNTDILAHCRQAGEHVRGCWVLDLILGKQ